MSEGKFKILHLSDVHLCDPAQIPEYGNDPMVLQSFLTTKFEDMDIDLVVVTGDIFDGRYINNPHCYPLKPNAEGVFYGDVFFNRLKELFTSDRILFAYGNHDLKVCVNRDKLTPGEERLAEDWISGRKDINTLPQVRSEFKKYCEKTPVLKSEHEFTTEFAKFIGCSLREESGAYSFKELENNLFFNFDEYLSGKPKHNLLAEDPFSYGVHLYDEANVIVVRINTSWQNISSKYLDGRLSAGKAQVNAIAKKVQEIKDSSNKKYYVVTLMHNAFNSFDVSDVHVPKGGDSSVILTITAFSDLILCGHEHGELPPSLMHFGTYLLKTGGLLNQDKRIRNSYSIIELNFEERVLRRNLYIYEGGSFNVVDSLSKSIEHYNVFELFPKKARNSIVNQSRDIEDYLQYFKDFDLVFSPVKALGVGGEDFAKVFTTVLKESPNTTAFFERKQELIRNILVKRYQNPVKR